MSSCTIINALLNKEQVFEFLDSGPYQKLPYRRVFLTTAARLWVDSVIDGDTGYTWAPRGNPGTRDGLQRLLYEEAIPCGVRGEAFCARTGRRVLLRRLEPYPNTRAEVWELRSFQPPVRLFGCFLDKGVAFFTHGSEKPFSRTDDQYELNSTMCETIREQLGLRDSYVFRSSSVHDYL